MFRSPFVVTLLILQVFFTYAQLNICGQNRTLGLHVVASLNLSFPGLESVSSAVAHGDLNAACEALAFYYQNSNSSYWLRHGPITPGTNLAGGEADAIVFNDTFNLRGVTLTTRIPRNSDGGLNWLDKGPRNDVEFMNCLNRFDSFVILLSAYQKTGNPIYVRYFDALVKDWVTHNPCPGAMSTKGKPCAPQGISGPHCTWGDNAIPGSQQCKTGTSESPWRSLEMGIRMRVPFPIAFFGFQRSNDFSTSARVLFILAVASHNEALAVDGGHPGVGTPNWEMTQWQGLVTSCVAFPELHNCSSLLKLAVSELQRLLVDGVYEDGVETEQSSGYDMGTADDFYSTISQLKLANLPPPPIAFTSRVEAMWNYGAYSV